jgi:hypothetical protein
LSSSCLLSSSSLFFSMVACASSGALGSIHFALAVASVDSLVPPILCFTWLSLPGLVVSML